jgi:N-dimethylarginine dimethylaminohydrolase
MKDKLNILFLGAHGGNALKRGNALRRLGHDVMPLAMSEFRKMDGGLSCLSLRS